MTSTLGSSPLPRTDLFADGTALTFVDQGQGRPVLVLHGGGGPFTVARFVDTMAQTHRVLAPTHPGFGGTPRADSLASIAQLAALYAELLDRLALTDVLVIGFSMGGWIAAELATLAGPRLRGVVLAGASGVSVAGQACADIFDLTPQQLSALSYHDPATYGIDPSKLSPEQKAGMAANIRTLAVYGRGCGMEDPTLGPRLADVQTPALLIWGESDRIVTPAYGRAYASQFPHARFALIERCGHMPQIEQPTRLLELVHGFDAAPERLGAVAVPQNR